MTKLYAVIRSDKNVPKLVANMCTKVYEDILEARKEAIRLATSFPNERFFVIKFETEEVVTLIQQDPRVDIQKL